MVLAVRILQFTPSILEALAAGDLARANSECEVELPADFGDPGWAGLWRMRRDQVHDDPTSAAWVTGAIVDADHGLCVGRAGFHGLPDERGMVEVGYTVLPKYRRRGYGRAALRVMLERVAEDPNVRVVRASISPGNVASRHLVAGFGFVEVGQQWDDEDGLELLFEVDPGDALAQPAGQT